MTKLKRKEESNKVQKVTKARKAEVKPKPIAEPFLGKEFWQASIAQLRSQEFESVEQARAAFVQEVVIRLGLGGELARETEHFLITLFETDPGVNEKLLSAVRIKLTD